MKCYKIIIGENSYNLESSRKLMLKLMRDILKDVIKLPHKEIAVMYEETNTYPKEYYFITNNEQLLNKVLTSIKGQLMDYPIDTTEHFSFLGNKKLFEQ